MFVKRFNKEESSAGEDEYEGEASSSFYLSKNRHQRKHSNQQDDIVNKKSFDKITDNKKSMDFDEPILVNEKFNIEINNMYGNKQFSNKNDESKQSSNKYTIKSDNKNIEIGYKSFKLDDMMVTRQESKTIEEQEKVITNMNFDSLNSSSNTQSQKQVQNESKVLPKERKEERKSIKSTENNNLDLHSVRYITNDISEERPEIALDIRNNDCNNPLLFSDLGK